MLDVTQPPEVIKRFLEYVAIDTTSRLPDIGSTPTKPSSAGQVELANLVKEDLDPWDLSIMDLADGSFMVLIPASVGCQSRPHLAFAVHLDTYFGLPGKVQPMFFQCAGQDIVLPNSGTVIPAEDLRGLRGKSIITSMGDTLLGADDKAGLAAMVTAIRRIMTTGIKHGPLSFWFCVDEETCSLDATMLPKGVIDNWDILFTLDGDSKLGVIETACFNGLQLEIIFKGSSAHPGLAGDKLRPAVYAAVELADLIPRHWKSPMYSSGREGFVYLYEVVGNASQARVSCDIRSFDLKWGLLVAKRIIDMANNVSGDRLVSCETAVVNNYVNIAKAIKGKRSLLEIAARAHRKFGCRPQFRSARAGTDGAMLNLHYPNLPAPNLSTGARNIHSQNEFLVVEELVKLVDILMAMVTLKS